MDKLLIFPGKTEKGIFTFLLDHEVGHLTKTAAEYHPEIAAYINAAKPIPNKTQILLTALGAGEWWGCNVNGDYFPENALAHPGEDYGYRTFETTAKVYRHHINKDPKASYGDVPLAVYNPKYHRVELIVAVDNNRGIDIVRMIEDGEYPEWSMGCRVPYDICSVCGNKAPTRKEYCEHLKYYMGRIDPTTGKQAYAINTLPRFFDISQVLIGADKIAKTLMKVASPTTSKIHLLSSAYLAEKMAENKEAEMEKEIPADPPASQDAVDTLVRSIPEVKARERSLPREVLDRLGSLPLKEIFSTLPLLGVVPKPQEFQRIILIHAGKKDVADQLDRHNMCFDPSWVSDPGEKHLSLMDMSAPPSSQVIRLMMPHMAERSYAMPFLSKRMVIMIKNAAEEEALPNFIKISEEDKERKPLGIIPLLMLAAGLYSAFGKKAPSHAVGSVDKMIAKHPLLAAALASALPIGFNAMAGTRVKGQYDSTGAHEGSDRNDIFARIEEQKQKPYLKIAGVRQTLGPASKRLFLGIPAVYMASGVLQKHREANPYEQEGRIKSFVRRNPDIVGAALAADAVMALKGKGSHRILKSVGSVGKGFWGKAQDYASGFAKTSSAQDFLTNALIWPVAFGSTNLPGRIVGGLTDQAVLEASRKFLSNKDQKPKLKTPIGGSNGKNP